MNEWFIVKDLEGFINVSRKLVFDNFGSKNKDINTTEDLLSTLDNGQQEELDEVLSYTEAMSIVQPFLKKQKHKKTLETRYLVDEDSYLSIINSLNDRLVSNLLNGLVNKGMIETAFDNQVNDFIFWVKDEYKQDIRKNFEDPETD